MKLNEIFGSHKDPFEDGYPDYFYPEKMTLDIRSENGTHGRNEYSIVMTVKGEKEYFDEIMDEIWDSIQSSTDWEIATDEVYEKKDDLITTYYVTGTPDFDKVRTLFDSTFKKVSDQIADRNADNARRNM